MSVTADLCDLWSHHGRVLFRSSARFIFENPFDRKRMVPKLFLGRNFRRRESLGFGSRFEVGHRPTRFETPLKYRAYRRCWITVKLLIGRSL